VGSVSAFAFVRRPAPGRERPECRNHGAGAVLSLEGRRVRERISWVERERSWCVRQRPSVSCSGRPLWRYVERWSVWGPFGCYASMLGGEMHVHLVA
jgi:hypothetical protein